MSHLLLAHIDPLPDAFVAEGPGLYRSVRTLTAKDIIDAAKALLSQRCQRIKTIADNQDAMDFFITQLSGFDYEVFAVAFLDVLHRVIAFEPMFRGTIDSSVVWPREVARRALELNASCVILAHNHPSGGLSISQEDQTTTQLVVNALSVLGMTVLDHILVAGSQAVSFVASGLLQSTITSICAQKKDRCTKT